MVSSDLGDERRDRGCGQGKQAPRQEVRGTGAQRGGGILEERQVQLPKEEHTEFGMQCGLQEVRPARWTAGRSPWVLETTRGDWTWLGSSGGGTEGFSAWWGLPLETLPCCWLENGLWGRWGPALLVARRGVAEEDLQGLAEPNGQG